ncbi:MAG: hypothetical protein LBP92_11325 [Deltaproteobacteria bacterium]|jgi:hypothetical protein|nr:hypothetical protein [Deltaproteobacteria bacterium]
MRIACSHDKGLVAVRADGEAHAGLLAQWGPRDRRGLDFVFPNDEGTLRRLWWLGADVTAAAPFRAWRPPLVEGRHAPDPHQLEMAAFMTVHPRCYNGSTPRTGKTGATAMALEYLRTHGMPGRTLVVCPLTIVETTWGRTLRPMTGAGVAILRGSRERRLKALGDGRPGYLVINPDGLKILEPELKAMIDAGEIDKAVIDELTAYGDHESGRWRVLNRLLNVGRRVPVVWGLSGTLTAGMEHVFGMARLVNREQLAYRSLTAWRGAIWYYWGTEAWQHHERPEAEDIVFQTLQPQIRYAKEDVIPDIPGLRTETVMVGLTGAQRDAIGELRDTGRAWLEGGQEIRGDRKASLVQKLFQISLGHVKAADGAVARLDAGPRLEAIRRIVADGPGKTVIFGTYVGVNEALVRHLRGRGLTVERVDGSVTGQRRDRIFRAFQDEADPRALVVHAMTTAYGTELSRADKMIFNGPMLSGTHVYLQALERLSSRWQAAAEVRAFHVFATAEERRFQEGLDGRATRANCMADAFKALTGGRA